MYRRLNIIPRTLYCTHQSMRMHLFMLMFLFLLGCSRQPSQKWVEKASLMQVECSNELAKQISDTYIKTEGQWDKELLSPNEILGKSFDGDLYISSSEDIFIFLPFHASIPPTVGRRYTSTGWEFYPWPYEVYGKRRKVTRESITSSQDDVFRKQEISDALYKQILQSVSISKLTNQFDEVFSNAPEYRDEWGSSKYNGVLWNSLIPSDKRMCILGWIRNLSNAYTKQEGMLYWAKDENVDYALLLNGMEDEFIFSIEWWPPELPGLIESEDASPRVLLSRKSEERQSVLIHTSLRRFQYIDEDSFPIQMTTFGDDLLLCFGSDLWVITENGTRSKRYEIPVRPTDTEGLINIPYAYYVREPYLYVFGQSKADAKKAVILRTDLRDFGLVPVE